jgi:hypothetical protein
MVLRFCKEKLNYEHVSEGGASEFYPFAQQLRREFGKEPFGPKDLIERMGTSRATAHRTLDRLSHGNLIMKLGYGVYRIN